MCNQLIHFIRCDDCLEIAPEKTGKYVAAKHEWHCKTCLDKCNPKDFAIIYLDAIAGVRQELEYVNGLADAKPIMDRLFALYAGLDVKSLKELIGE